MRHPLLQRAASTPPGVPGAGPPSNTITADFTANVTTIYAGQSVEFRDISSAGKAASRRWQPYRPGDVSSISAQEEMVTVKYVTAGTYDVHLVVTTHSGASDTEAKAGYITVLATPVAPVASFTTSPSPATGFSPLSVTFTNTSTGTLGADPYRWDFGNGQTATGAGPHTIKYLGGGGQVFQAKLTVTDAAGQTSIATATVTVNSPVQGPTAGFTYTPHSGTVPPPLTINFTNTTTGGTAPLTYAWERSADGGVEWTVFSTSANPSAQSYSDPGAYLVRLTVTDNNGITSTTTPAPVTVSSNPVIRPVAAFTASPTQGNVPLTVAFTNASTGTAPLSYSWDFGDGSEKSEEQNPSHTYQSADAFKPTLTVTDALGLTDELTAVIVVSEVPAVDPLAADFTASPQSGAAPLIVQFTNTTDGGVPPYSFAWNYGDGTTATNPANPHTHTFTNTGATPLTRTVTLTATDSSSPTPQTHSIEQTVTVGINPAAPIASFNASPTAGDSPMLVNFTNNSSGGVAPFTYAWNFGGGLLSGQSNTSNQQYPGTRTYVNTTASPTTRTITLTVTGNNGFSNTMTRTVTVNPSVSAPVASFTASPHSGTVPFAVTVDNTSVGGIAPLSYAWVFGDPHATALNPNTSTAAEPGSHTYTVASTTPYTIGLTVTDSHVPPRSSTFTVNITANATVNPPPIAGFTANQTSGQSPLAVTFTNTSTGAGSLTYAWNFGDPSSGASNTSTATNPSHTFTTSVDTAYTVTLTTTSQYGSDTHTMVIVVTAVPQPLAGTVTFNVLNGASYALSGYPVGVSVPLHYADNKTNTDTMRILDSANNPVACQFRVLSRWFAEPTTSGARIKVVHCYFPANVPAATGSGINIVGGSATYKLQLDAQVGQATAGTMTVAETGASAAGGNPANTFTITSGTDVFRVSKDVFTPLYSARIGGVDILTAGASTMDFRLHSDAAAATATVLSTVLEVGNLATGNVFVQILQKGVVSGLPYKARWRFRQGQKDVEFECWARNNTQFIQYPEIDDGTTVKWIGRWYPKLALVNSGTVTATSANGSSTLTGAQRYRLMARLRELGAVTDRVTNNDYPGAGTTAETKRHDHILWYVEGVDDALTAHVDSVHSGTTNWVPQSGANKVSTGGKYASSVAAKGSAGSVLVCADHFYERAPYSIEATASGVEVGICPADASDGSHYRSWLYRQRDYQGRINGSGGSAAYLPSGQNEHLVTPRAWAEDDWAPATFPTTTYPGDVAPPATAGYSGGNTNTGSTAPYTWTYPPTGTPANPTPAAFGSVYPTHLFAPKTTSNSSESGPVVEVNNVNNVQVGHVCTITQSAHVETRTVVSVQTTAPVSITFNSSFSSPFNAGAVITGPVHPYAGQAVNERNGAYEWASDLEQARALYAGIQMPASAQYRWWYRGTPRIEIPAITRNNYRLEPGRVMQGRMVFRFQSGSTTATPTQLDELASLTRNPPFSFAEAKRWRETKGFGGFPFCELPTGGQDWDVDRFLKFLTSIVDDNLAEEHPTELHRRGYPGCISHGQSSPTAVQMIGRNWGKDAFGDITTVDVHSNNNYDGIRWLYTALLVTEQYKGFYLARAHGVYDRDLGQIQVDCTPGTPTNSQAGKSYYESGNYHGIGSNVAAPDYGHNFIIGRLMQYLLLADDASAECARYMAEACSATPGTWTGDGSERKWSRPMEWLLSLYNVLGNFTTGRGYKVLDRAREGMRQWFRHEQGTINGPYGSIPTNTIPASEMTTAVQTSFANNGYVLTKVGSGHPASNSVTGFMVDHALEMIVLLLRSDPDNNGTNIALTGAAAGTQDYASWRSMLLRMRNWVRTSTFTGFDPPGSVNFPSCPARWRPTNVKHSSGASGSWSAYASSRQELNHLGCVYAIFADYFRGTADEIGGADGDLARAKKCFRNWLRWHDYSFHHGVLGNPTYTDPNGQSSYPWIVPTENAPFTGWVDIEPTLYDASTNPNGVYLAGGVPRTGLNINHVSWRFGGAGFQTFDKFVFWHRLQPGMHVVKAMMAAGELTS